MKLSYSHYEMEVLAYSPSRYMGVAWSNPLMGRIYYLPIPLNVVAGKIVACYWWARSRWFGDFERQFLKRLAGEYTRGYDDGESRAKAAMFHEAEKGLIAFMDLYADYRRQAGKEHEAAWGADDASLPAMGERNK